MEAYKKFNQLFKKKSLKSIYLEHVQASSAVGIDKISRATFESRLDDEVSIIKRKALDSSYSFTPFKQKLISKGADSYPRVISIPTYRDRITLRALCNLLYTVFKSDLNVNIPQVKIELIKKNIHKKKFNHYVKIDVSNFYPSINHNRLLSIVKKRIRKKQVLNLIESCLENPTVPKSIKNKNGKNLRGVPQGLSVSNVLAELFLSSLDSEFSDRTNLLYVRYVDDILILCKKNEAKIIANEVIARLQNIELEPHPISDSDSKSCLGKLQDDFGFLGYQFSNRATTIKEQNRQRLESSIVNIFTTFKYNYDKQRNVEGKNRAIAIFIWRLNIRITGCIFDNKKRGWIFYFSQVDDISVLYKIDKTISSLTTRFGLSERISPKKLVKTFHESQRKDKSSHKYIPNFDVYTSLDKRLFLELYLGTAALKGKKDEDIERMFNMRISKVIEELEEDLQQFS